MRLLAEACVVGGSTAGYLWIFRLYGFDVVDEGTLLAQIARAAAGARPYVDFETGYTPGFFAFYAWLWGATGADLVATRLLGIVVQGATAALLYALAALAAGRRIALAAVLLQVAFLLPVSLRFGAHFNIPYPGWLAMPLLLIAQAAVWARGRISRPGLGLVVAGLAAGVAFSVKPNAGLLALGGVALATPLEWSAAQRSAVILSSVLRVAAVLATLVLLAGGIDPAYFLALVVPVTLAARLARPGRAEPSHPFRDLLLLGASFLAPVLPWLVPLCLELGLERVAREVLLLDGGGVIESYLLPYPLPEASTVVLLAGLSAAAAVAWSEKARRAPLVLLLALVAAAPVAEGGARLAAENAWHWLPIAVLLAGFVVARPSERALHGFAAVQLVQMFPRPDLIHLAQIGPSLLVACAVTWRGVARAWRRRVSDPVLAARLARAVFGLVVVLCVARLGPSLGGLLLGATVPLPGGARGELVIAAESAPDFAWLGELVGALERRSDPDDPVFAFPDLAGAAFLAGRPTPFFYLYFVPGRPDRRGEARVIEDLRQIAPPLAVVGRARVPAFAGAETYFRSITRYLGDHYQEVASGEGFRVLERTTAFARAP